MTRGAAPARREPEQSPKLNPVGEPPGQARRSDGGGKPRRSPGPF
jgi:hypothetical protein